MIHAPRMWSATTRGSLLPGMRRPSVARFATPGATPVRGCPVVNEQPGQGYIEGLRELDVGVDAGVRVTVLNAADVAPADAGALLKPLLP